MRFFHFCFLLSFSLQLFAAPNNSYIVDNKDLGIYTILPGSDWKVFEERSVEQYVFLYISSLSKSRLALMSFTPGTYKDMNERSRELSKSAHCKILKLENVIIDNKKAQRLIYSLYGSHVIELGFVQGYAYTIIQLTTNVAVWQTSSQIQSWENVFWRLKWRKNKQLFRLYDQSSKNQIKSFLNPTTVLSKCRTIIKVNTASIDINCSFNVQLETPRKITLFIGIGRIHDVLFSPKTRCRWQIETSPYPGVQKIIIYNKHPRKHVQIKASIKYQRGKCIKLHFPSVSPNPISYKHTIHYSKNLSLVTNHLHLQTLSIENGLNVCRYQENINQHSPFCLYIGKQTAIERISPKNKLVALGVGKEIVSEVRKKLFILQKLLNQKITFDVVITNQAFSHGHFLYTPSIKSTKELSFIKSLAMLWLTHLHKNVRLGMANYLGLIYILNSQGEKAYHSSIDREFKKYTQSNILKEYALAHPLSITHPKVTTAKFSFVLNMLRNRLQDKEFEIIWQKIVHDKKIHSYEDILKTFSISFLNQWFFRAGYPRLHISWSQKKVQLLVNIHQQIKGSPFVFTGEIYIVCEKKTYTMPVTINQLHQRWFIASEDKVENVYFKYK
ncbi:hypothetical protein [Candidatus Uabimicrobium sp. HlEnr_7]|uniref:hypothetical protein n=1 Tax=Candidatus Uabimicrobium helgolandensis TaxID=3095367 RepID=UPI003558B39A